MATETVGAAGCRLDLRWHDLYWGGKPSGIACGEPSFALATFACVHEHLDRVPICAGCSIELQRAAGGLTCPHCWDAPKDAHACYGLVVIDWASGEKTIVQEARRG